MKPASDDSEPVTDGPAAPSPTSPPGGTARERGTVRSADLFAGRRDPITLHGDDEYRLRLTRAGKLILTK